MLVSTVYVVVDTENEIGAVFFLASMAIWWWWNIQGGTKMENPSYDDFVEKMDRHIHKKTSDNSIVSSRPLDLVRGILKMRSQYCFFR